MSSAAVADSILRPNDFQGFWIDVAARNAMREYNRLLRPSGINATQYFALLLLAATPGVRPSDLATELRIEASSLTGHLDRLETLGLVSRTSDPDDRRVNRVALTERGTTLLTALRPVGDAMRAYEPGVAAAASAALVEREAADAASSEAQRAIVAIADAFRDVSAAFAAMGPTLDPQATLATIADRVERTTRKRMITRRTLRVATLTSRESPVGVLLARFGELVERASRGRVRVQLEIPSHGAGGELETLVDLRSGAYAIASITASVAGNLMTDAQLLELPYLVDSYDHACRLLDGAYGDAILRDADRFELAGLAIALNGFRSITTRDRIVRTPADARGLRIRVQQSPINVYFAEALDAVAVPIPFPRLAAALREGEVDGQENALANIVGLELWSHQRHLTMTRHAMSPHIVLGNARMLSQLGNDEALVRAAMTQALGEHRAAAASIEERLDAELGHRLAIVRPTPAAQTAFRDAFRLVRERMAFSVGSEPIARILAAATAAAPLRDKDAT